MPLAWYKDDSCENRNADSHFDPPRFISLAKLKSTVGVECLQVDVDDLKNAKEYWQLRKERGYDYDDMVEISKRALKDEFEAKLKIFYTEHLHSDEEVRLFVEGSGYFDVRDNKDIWVRLHVSKGDLIIFPGGIYHRFALDKGNFAKVHRLFHRVPEWAAKYRPDADEEPVRKEYLNRLLKLAA